MQPPPQNLHLMLTRCQNCKTLFHLRFERWVSHCIFPLKASLLAFCRELMQPFWTQMYFEMSKLLTSYWWVEQWFGFTTRGWMGTVLYLLCGDTTDRHFFHDWLSDLFRTRTVFFPSNWAVNTFHKSEWFSLYLFRSLCNSLRHLTVVPAKLSCGDALFMKQQLCVRGCTITVFMVSHRGEFVCPARMKKWARSVM